jgi:hypothetical protein
MFVSATLGSGLRKTARGFLACLVMGVLSACGGGGGGASIQSGQFLDSAVSGLAYSTESRSGVTDAYGRFYYWPGETVTFYLQGLYIGQALGASVLTPPLITPAGKHTDYSLNVLRLLQSLDSDRTPSNGISLPSWQIPQNIILDQSADSFTTSQGAIDLINAAPIAYPAYPNPFTLVSAGNASDHFGDTLKTLASNSNYTLNLSTRTVSRATMRVDTCPDQESVWSLVFNAQNVSISGNLIAANCSTNAWLATPLPYVDNNGGTSMKTNAFFVPCGPVCTLAELNQTFTATGDDMRPFSAKVAHMANTREILITKSYTDGGSPSTAYFRLLLAAP